MKRKAGLAKRFTNWLLGEPEPTVNQAIRQHFGNQTVEYSITQLPLECDNALLNGDRYVNGVCCRTVGEYKDAIRNNGDAGGWS
jgi:hypothetical protein